MIIEFQRWVEFVEFVSEKYDFELSYQYDEHFSVLKLVLKEVRERKVENVPKADVKEAAADGDEDKAKIG